MRTVAWVGAALALAITTSCKDRDRGDVDRVDAGDQVQATGDRAANDVQKAADETGNAVDSAADDVGDAAKGAGSDVKEAAKDVGDEFGATSYERRDEFRRLLLPAKEAPPRERRAIRLSTRVKEIGKRASPDAKREV